MTRIPLALGAWLVLWNITFVPSLQAQDPAADQKADKVTERVATDTDEKAEDAATDPVKIGTVAQKLAKFCAQDENKDDDRCAGVDQTN